MIATSGFLTALECTKFDFGRGSASDPAGGAYSGGKGTGKEGREGRAEVGEGQGKGRMEGKG